MRAQFLFISFIITWYVSSAQIVQSSEAQTIYESIDDENMVKPDFDVFQIGFAGYCELENNGKIPNERILTLIDFRKSGNERRMWVIDLVDKKVLYHTLVAHGRNSGELYASKFSNILNSNQSSLGFYLTGSVYSGKHGTSLKLKGLEKGINDNASQRAIVMHGAEYVSEKFIEKAGRLGRSFGCPAIPMEIHEQVIRLLADGTCLFIYYPDVSYQDHSIFFNANTQ